MIRINPLNSRTETSAASKLIARVGVSTALVACIAMPGVAYADVRQDDLVVGKSVADRELDDASCPDILAEYAYVIDSDGHIYFQRNDEAATNIASVTKIMTALVAMENATDDLVITVSENAANIGESNASLEAGDTMSLYEALKALMISSGNDAAQAIAESVGGSILGNWDDPAASTQAFVDAMNAKAESLGMTDTLFTNPHGLDDEGFESDQHSCASDVAIMCSIAMQDDMFRNVVSKAETTCTVNRGGENETIDLVSTDQLTGSYEGACGIKTGFTDLAGGCFAGACNRGEADLYAVVLGSEDEDTRFDDTRALWDWVYNNTVEYPLANSDETVTKEDDGEEVPLVARVSCASWIDKTVDATLANPEETASVFTLQGDITQEAEYEVLEGTVNAGDKVGVVTYTQDGETIATADLIAAQTVEEPKWYEKAIIWLKRLYFGLVGEPIQAESVLLLEETQSPTLENDAAEEEAEKSEAAEDEASEEESDSEESSDADASSEEPAEESAAADSEAGDEASETSSDATTEEA